MMDGSKAKLNGSTRLSKLSSADSLYRGSGVGVVHSNGYWGQPERKVWLVVMFVGVAVLYASRTAFPVAMVDMAEGLGWDKKTSGTILSSFYCGYILTQVVGGRLANRHGGDLVICASSFIWSLVSLSLSFVPYISKAAVILTRFMAGLAQGVYMPALVDLFVHRVHESERNLLLAIIWTGAYVGSATAGGVGSLLLHVSSWPSVFVAFGLAGLVWATTLKMVFHRSQHQTHYKISDNSRGRERLKLDVPSVSIPGVPWRKILSKPAILVLFFSYFAECFFLHNMMSWLPTYFHDSFPNMRSHAWVYTSLPWLMVALGTLLGGLSVHWMDRHGVGMTTVRKTVTAIGLGGSSLFLILVSALESAYHSSLLLLTLSCFLSGVGVAGPSMNVADLTPNYIGPVYAALNTVGTLPGIFGVVLSGYLLDASSSWPLVFCAMAGTNLLGLSAYLLCGSGQKLQLDS